MSPVNLTGTSTRGIAAALHLPVSHVPDSSPAGWPYSLPLAPDRLLFVLPPYNARSMPSLAALAPLEPSLTRSDLPCHLGLGLRLSLAFAPLSSCLSLRVFSASDFPRDNPLLSSRCSFPLCCRSSASARDLPPSSRSLRASLSWRSPPSYGSGNLRMPIALRPLLPYLSRGSGEQFLHAVPRNWDIVIVDPVVLA
ncbi:unnamed protein product [Closterium sp. NIES-65]|nr:unnamed protein product [Closterium sp. NIES-65]